MFNRIIHPQPFKAKRYAGINETFEILAYLSGKWGIVLEKIVDWVAPRSRFGAFLNAAILVGCFTAVDYLISGLASGFTARSELASVLVTYLIGAPFGLFVMAIMIVQRQLKDRLQYMSETDPLTGLPNRAAFFEKANLTINNGKPHAILMVDIDNFKAINDTYGHYAGDLALAQIGKHLHRTLRSEDIVGRIGGEEFAVLLNNVELPAIAELTSKICDTITIQSRRASDHQIQSFKVTMSIGSVIASPGQKLVDLMRFADEALYQAKANGQNRVIFHEFECTKKTA